LLASNSGTRTTSEIFKLLQDKQVRFHASDNISQHLLPSDRKQMIAEATELYDKLLRTFLIDVDNDANSKDTPHRLAKMQVNELFQGRYEPSPKVTAFPNIRDEHTEKYEGMLVVRAEIRSVCSHHWQPVHGTCFIGILPSDKVIGLSKYVRIAQHCARRGTLQEELAQTILKQIKESTGSRDVGVYIESEHGCMTNRGVMAHNSTTQTTALAGQFFNNSIKKEFFDNIMLQKSGRG
jgi:GTP cyclohydrolase I